MKWKINNDKNDISFPRGKMVYLICHWYNVYSLGK